MKIGLKEKDLQLNQEVLEMNNININNKINDLNRNNDQSSTKEDENYMILDDPIEYCSSPKIGLVSKHCPRNKNNRFIQLTEYKTDIPSTISIYVKQINDLEKDKNNSNNKLDINFFNKKQQTHVKPEKRKEKKSILINSYSTVAIKSLKMEKTAKRLENKKKVTTKKQEKVKTGKKWEKIEKTKDKDKIFKRKSTSYSITALSEKMNKIKNHLNKHQELKDKDKSKDEITENDEVNSISKSKSKSKINIEENDMKPNIIIYGSESSSENNTKSIKEKDSNDNNEINENNEKNNLDDYFKTKKYSNISSGNNKLIEKDDHKIIKPKSKHSTNLINKMKKKVRMRPMQMIKKKKKKKQKTKKKTKKNSV